MYVLVRLLLSVYVVHVMCALWGACVCAQSSMLGAWEHNFEMKAQPALAMSQVLLQQWHAPGT
jgi:hypothetical protein